MTLNPRPFRMIPMAAALAALVLGLLSAAPGSDAPVLGPPWSPVTLSRPAPPVPESPPPPEPVSAVPYAPPVPLPSSLAALEEMLLRPETREWTSIVVHHSAGESGNAAEFDAFHRAAHGWEFGLGYHFVVGNGKGAPAGGTEVGQRWLDQRHGAHAGGSAKAQEFNQHGIGVCVVGNFMTGEMSEEVYAGLRDLVIWLAKRYAIAPDRVLPHSGVRGEPTDCPGVKFPLDRLRADVADALRK